MTACACCGREVPLQAGSCPACGRPIGQQPAGGSAAGGPIDVGNVLSKSLGLLRSRPALFIPFLFPALLSLAEILASASGYVPVRALAFACGIVGFVFGVLVVGAYPLLVRAAVGGTELPIMEAIGASYRRFWTLLAAMLAVGLLVLLGTVALVVPGMILATWYAYTVPSVVLDGMGFAEGMGASKAFGRTRKWSTFLMFLAFGVMLLPVVVVVETLTFFVSPVLGGAAEVVLTIPIGVWAYVAVSYTYMTYRPATPPPGAFASAAQGPAPQPAAPGGFCASCGSQLAPGSRFCPSCGKAA